MATGYLRADFETSPGNESNTPTLSTKNIYVPILSFQPTLNPSHLMRDDELRNIDEPLAALTEAYNPNWSISARLYPDLTAFILKMMLGAPTTTAGNGTITDPDSTAIPSGAYRHVWTAPFGPSGINPQTAQFQAAYKDQTVFYKLKGCGCGSISIESPETGGCRITASGPALYMARISDPSLSPSYESLSVRPFERGNLTIATWLANTANTEDFSLQLANPQQPYRSLAIASKFPDQLEKADTPITCTGSIPKRVIDADDYDALLNATGFATKVKWVSDSIIASGYPYKLFVEMANAQYTDGGPEALANKRRLGASFNWKATNSSGSAGHVTITLVNATTSYA